MHRDCPSYPDETLFSARTEVVNGMIAYPRDVEEEMGAFCRSRASISDATFFNYAGGALMRSLLVTGSSSGIGRAIAQRLLEEGHQVIGISRTPERFDPGLTVTPPTLKSIRTKSGRRHFQICRLGIRLSMDS